MDFTGIILILIIVGGVWALAEWRFASKHEHKKYWYRPTEEWMFGEMLDIDEAVERLWMNLICLATLPNGKLVLIK